MAPTSVPITVVDTFAERPFTGNPAAVCVLQEWPSDRWMQQVATEMNLSETAFVVLREDGDRDLRWFTPTVEVDLCGHATLASAHVLATATGERTFRFHTRSGVLTSERLPDGKVRIDLPVAHGAVVPLDPGVVEALGAAVRTIEAGAFLLAEVADAGTVRELQPDIGALARLHPHAVIVTAAGDGEHDFVSRVFCPNAGIPEDPVTGSAHCQLAPFWAARLGREELRGYQASARGGVVGVRLAGDRVEITGAAVTILEGSLAIAPAEPPSTLRR